ncbi:MAG: M20/M25/M40 family metallo-hydrolase [Acidobacteriota bacterium]
MRTLFRSAVFVAVFYSLAVAVAPAQKNQVDERNVRAEMNFLASDAMQGRGSGTIFERVAAEYIGSQFMQFGLEPAGEKGADGKPTYVQTVDVTRSSFDGPVTLKFGSTKLENGKGMLVLRTNTGPISGNLQRLRFGETPTSGSAAFFLALEGEDPNKVKPNIQGLMSSGASIVIIEETPQIRESWGLYGNREIKFTELSDPKMHSVLIVVSKDAAKTLVGVADGTQIEFGGELVSGQKQQTWNAMGKITGSDKTLSSEVMLLTAHLDHLGVRESNPGNDKIFNGADDDTSGSIAVLELARVLGRGIHPKRTVYFVCFGSEEAGGYGASFFVNNLPFPKDKLVANLEFEMIGRPDAKVKPEELWLTGYERTNLGPELAKRGAKLVADPHPDQKFFQRSDNITLARAGIVAQTVSSFGLHKDYHQASDEIETIDFVHMTRSINSMIKPVQWLVNTGWKPSWNEGQRP